MPKNKLLITGNGFDLALGYRTKYEHFLTYLLYAKDHNLNKLRLYTIKEWGVSDFKEEDLSNFKKLLSDVMDTNFIISYFINYHEKTLTWADFETELLHLGCCLESIILSLENEQTDAYLYYDIKLPYTQDLKYYGEYLSFIKDNYYFKIDIDSPIRRDNSYFIRLKINDVDEISDCKTVQSKIIKFKELLPKYYYEDILVLSKLFELYLDIESKRMIENIKPKFNISKVITYNFTNFSNYFCNTLYHINGELSIYEGKENGIIFGIDTNNTFRTTIFNGATKQVQRAANGIKINRFLNSLGSLDSLYIFGYSLTVADKDSMKLIFDLVKKNKDCKIIIFYKAKGNKNDDLLTKIYLANNLKTILEDDFNVLIEHVDFQDSSLFFKE